MRLGTRSEARAGWAFVTPAIALIAVFFFVPALAAFILSLTDFDLYSIADPSRTRFVGLGNYTDLVGDPLFRLALRNTAYFVLVGTPLSIAASLGAALLLQRRLGRLQGFFRTAWFAPYVTSLVAVAIVWRYLYQPEYGWVNAVLRWAGLPGVNWLGDPRWAMPAIVMLAVWKNFGYNMIVFLAGLQSIPGELYEAAALDGAGPWRRFRDVTVPMLGPTLTFVGIITLVGYFQVFAEPYVMTQGGPLRSTTTVVLLMYEQGFRWWQLGRGAAVAFVLFAIMLVITMLQLRLRREDA